MTTSRISARTLVETLNAHVSGGRQLVVSDEQEAVIEAPLTPHLVVAGAGSGKTETMSLRVLWLIANYGFPPDRILGLTFTRKAAGELASRLRVRIMQLVNAGLIPSASQTPWFAGGVNVSTYNAFASSILREYGLLLGIDPNARLITDAAAWQIMEQILSTYTGELPEKAASTIRDDALSLSAALADHDVELDEADKLLDEVITALEAAPADGRMKSLAGPAAKWLAGAQEQRLLLGPIAEYRRYKRDEAIVDFADQLVFARQLVKEHPDVATDIRGNYDAVLLDEFQDTSVGQMDLLSGLFKQGAVTAVGDPNQAIYGWRGASSASLATFLDHFDPESVGRTLHLTYAWRNQPRILEAANEIARPLSDSSLGRLEIKALNPSDSHVPGSGTITYVYPENEDDAYELVARAVKKWQTEDEKRNKELQATGQSGSRSVKRQTFGILARNRRHFIPMLEACVRHDIEAVVIGLGGLVTQPAIADIRAAITACLRPDHGPSAMRLLANLDLSATDLVHLHTWASELHKRRSANAQSRGGFLIDAIDNPPPIGWGHGAGPGFSARADQRVRLLSQRLRQLRAILDQPITYVVSACVRIFAIDIETKADPTGNAAMEAIDAFIDVAASFEQETIFATLDGFIDWIDTAIDAEQGLTAPDFDVDDHVVRIMTIHQAKGLEWDKVAVIGLREGDFPQVSGAQYLKFSPNPPEVSDALSIDLRPTTAWIGSRGEAPYDWRTDYRSPDGTQILPAVPELDGLTVREVREAVDQYTLELAEHAEREERRLAYVAYTRPKNELLLAGAWERAGVATTLLPSRYLLDLIKSGHAVPATADDFAGDPETLPTPVVTVCPPREENAENEHSTRVFPRQPGYVRNLINHAARTAVEIREQFTARGGGIEAIAYDKSNEEESELVHSVTQAIIHEREKATQTIPTVHIDHISATVSARLLSDMDTFALNVRRPVPHEPSDAALLGSAFHRWAESWCRLAASFAEETEPATQAPVDAVGEMASEYAVEPLTDHQRQKLNQFKAVAIELYGERPDNIIAVEKPFSLSLDGLTVRGRMDAVALRDGRFCVIDWKTGRPPTPEHAGHAWDYAVQLEIYRRALAAEKNLPLDDIDAELVFLGGRGFTSQQRRVTIETVQQILGGFDFDQVWAATAEAIATAD
ncbi:MAG: ATP-dependent DNA helicase [Actinomycetaceae bacterium]|nr:ATP-dependent DNA helicase [Actinomycetaceae bacterium]